MKEFPEWHYTKNGDFPEKYTDCVTYSYKCNEFTLPVLVVTKSKYNTYKAIRARFTNEENFKWWAAKGIDKPLKFSENDIIMWTFLPSRDYLKNLVKNI